MNRNTAYPIIIIALIAGCQSVIFRHSIEEHRHRILHDRYYDRHDEKREPAVKDQKAHVK